MTWRHVASTAINISAGGFFVLKSANGKSIVVSVVPTLPVGNTSQTFIIVKGVVFSAITGNKLSRGT